MIMIINIDNHSDNVFDLKDPCSVSLDNANPYFPASRADRALGTVD